MLEKSFELLHMTKMNYKGRSWVLVLICGLIGLIVGVSLAAYGLLVVANGRFPAQFSSFLTTSMFCLGYGIGCTSVAPLVKKLEQKP
jgi:hypothetical protein